MDTDRFAITKEGQVYRLGGHGRQVLLGQISCLAREETPLGREVRAWWQATLASSGPIETPVTPRSGGEEVFVSAIIPETGLVVDSQSEHELAESILAAD